jgi:hypothetical protein
MGHLDMRIGYSFWGFLGDHKIKDGKEVSTPDGNASYSWSIMYEMLRRGYTIYQMQQDRDVEGDKKFGKKNYASFSQKKRMFVRDHEKRISANCSLPELDLLLVEWRFPISGRNCSVSQFDPLYQPDLDRQTEILRYYVGSKTRVILWDLDHKLDRANELVWPVNAIIETSLKPIQNSIKRTTVYPPFVIDDLLQFPTLNSNETRKLVYVGSRYERDEMIDKWIAPISNIHPRDIEFYGNWTKEPCLSECKSKWPNIRYYDRITMRDFRDAYGTAAACPLLAKQSYLESGFITPRVWEAILFGTIPIGFKSHFGVEGYTLHVAEDVKDFESIIDELAYISYEEKTVLLEELADRVSFMDVKFFVDTLETV